MVTDDFSVISIHALLAESDLYINNLLTETAISIHALLAESDLATYSSADSCTDFYPRSPCGERQPWCAYRIRQRYFYPRSPCGERPYHDNYLSLGNFISIHALRAESDRHHGFLWPARVRFRSTLSLRRATVASVLETCGPRYFYPRSPCGERPDQSAG